VKVHAPQALMIILANTRAVCPPWREIIVVQLFMGGAGFALKKLNFQNR